MANRELQKVASELKLANEDLAAKADKLQHYELILKLRDDKILRPLKAARLVVRISCEDLRDDLDLDLYVQDPENELCYWKQPRVLTRYLERATLIPSEDLRTVGENSADKRKQRVTEEVYYAAVPLVEPSNRPYLVFCMVRKVGPFENSEAVAINVSCEILIKNAAGTEFKLASARKIRSTGSVRVADNGESYPGLVPLTGFRVTDLEKPAGVLLEEKELPELLRGWDRRSPDKNVKVFGKLRDGESR